MTNHTQTTSPHDRTRSHRPGAVMVVVLVIILIMTGLTGTFVRRVLLDRRTARRDLDHLQATELAAAAEDRVEFRRRTDPGYAGETWKLPAGEIHETKSAEVVITLNDDTVTIVARYPANEEWSCQVTKQVQLEAR